MTRISRFALVALAAVAVIAMPLFEIAAVVGRTCRRSIDAAFDLFESFAAKLAPVPTTEPTNPEPQVRLIAARQYVQRFIKREVPSITSRYRMCPST